ncbi:MAG TPA: GDSL-type esterase/lipase family protein [Blastocatellia bacterium]|nr:GDSL-type esterase/lipase family protein [Blastocatellia bacterium]
MRKRDNNLVITRAGGEVSLLLALPCLALLGASLTFAATRACYSPHGPITRQPIENPDGRALESFYQSLALTSAQREAGESDNPAITRIIHYGDSHVAADILTGALRRYFQQDFGDAGPGFILAGRPWPWYSRGGVESGASIGWQSNGLSQSSLTGDGRFGLAGVSLSATRAGEIIRMTSACPHFEIYLLRQPGGGTIDVLLDGELQHHRFSLASDDFEPAYLELSAPADSATRDPQSAIESPHSIELRTVSPGMVRVLGLTAERYRAGVVYDALGINGARATRLLEWDEALLADNLARRNPDLIIVAYGSNEAGDADFDPAEYRRKFSEVLKRLRAAAPDASLLVIAPPDRAVRTGSMWRTISTMPGLVAAQRQAALAAGAAFWDLYRAMGGAGSIERWAIRSPPLAQPDRVHLTRSGYLLVADELYAELMRGYRQFTSRS